MWRRHLGKLFATGALGAALTAGFVAPSEALTLPVRSAASVAGPAPAEQIYYGYYYRRRYNPAGAFVAGAAIGLIGAAAIAASRPYYAYPSYGYYPAYYGYYPRAYYGYPVRYYRRAYYGGPYWGYRRVYYARPYYGGYRRAYWRRW